MSWREIAAPIIANVIASKPEDLRRALRDAYPFGPRRHWPYKVWLDEIARQLGRGPTIDNHSGDLFL